MRTAIPPELTGPCRLLFARRGIPTGRGIPPPGLVPVVSRPALRLRRHGAGSRLLLWPLGTANQLAYDPSRSRASSWVGWFRFENHFRLFFSKYFFFVSKHAAFEATPLSATSTELGLGWGLGLGLDPTAGLGVGVTYRTRTKFS